MYDIHRLEPFYSPGPEPPPDPGVAVYQLYYNRSSNDGVYKEIVWEAHPTLPSISEIPLAAPTGKEFKEWNSSRDGNGDSYSVGDTASPGYTYYAIWQDTDTIDYLTNNLELASVAAAIRSKGGTLAPLTYPNGFVDAIDAIVLGVDVSNTTAIPSTVLSGYKFYKSNGFIATGTMPSKSASDLSASGKTVTVPYGYYETQCTKDVATGSATTPATSITANPSISVDSSGLITSSVSTSQSVTPTVVSGYVSSGTSGTVTVSGSNTSQLSTQIGTTISPTESEQTAVSAGKYTTGAVKVGAVSSTYVGSGIDRNDSTDLTVSGATVTAPAGYYAADATKSIASGSATTPATTITSNPSISVSSSGLITATNSKTQSVTPTVSAGYVSSGTAGTITVSGSNTSQLTVQSAQTITPTTSNQTITSGKYLTGTQTILGDVNLIAENIRQNKTIFGITGTYTFPDANGVSF